MALIEFYEEAIRSHAISAERFTQLVYAYFGDTPENIGPCIRNTESISEMVCRLPDRTYIRIHTSELATNTDLRFEPQPGSGTSYPAAGLLRGVCMLFKQSVCQFYKAKKPHTGAGMQVTIVMAVYQDGRPVYFGDLNAPFLS